MASKTTGISDVLNYSSVGHETTYILPCICMSYVAVCAHVVIYAEPDCGCGDRKCVVFHQKTYIFCHAFVCRMLQCVRMS